MTASTTAYTATLGRLLLAALFLISGVGKLAAPAATKAYIAASGMPFPELAYLGAILVEVGFAGVLILGYRARLVAAVMALFTLVTALAFHLNLADPAQQIQLLKNLAITGGLLQIVAFGAGALSLDNRSARAPRTA